MNLQSIPSVAIWLALASWLLGHGASVHAQVLDHQKLLTRQTFWDNRDWDWYQADIPFFECPDEDINTTYYYRWELVTKHLTYGSPNSGYSFTEFIDRPFWSGAYGAISCPAGHQLYEVRWLRDPQYARDYAAYWFRTEGAQPRRYSCWLADAVWAVEQVHPDKDFTTGLLTEMVKNYEGWEQRHWVPEVGLFWQTGHDDGMEININSRQTKDTVRGAPAFRPTLNSYLWADALAIARVARLAGKSDLAAAYEKKAVTIKENLQKKLWDAKRQFFFPMAQRDEEADGHTVKGGSLTHQTGRHAGSPHGRELIGYVPWQFNLPDVAPGKGADEGASGDYAAGWKFLMDRDYFLTEFGPTTTERRDPMFALSRSCCWWSGQSWPYATTQTLKAMANLLQNYEQKVVSKSDYYRLLQIYTLTHRKGGKPYIAEAAHPDNGSWDGHDSYNHSEHYFHSGYNDLIITGLVGLRPRDDDTIEIDPLAPEEWEYFALEDVPYRGRRVTVLWDKTGKRYGRGAGLHILIDGKRLTSAEKLQRLSAKMPTIVVGRIGNPSYRPVNYAVNNDGTYYPRITASYVNAKTPLANVIDGNYWYHASPPNRWTCEGSPNASDWVAIDFGTPRKIHTVKLYVLDDAAAVVPPKQVELQVWDGKGTWLRLSETQGRVSERLDHVKGRQANVIHFPEVETRRVRAVFTHAGAGRTGLTEFEVWGDGQRPVAPAPEPKGNLALNTSGKGYPKATASFTSRFDKVEMANDGRINFRPSPANRWTAYESPNASDWLEIDFGPEKGAEKSTEKSLAKTVGRVDLHLYDDRGGVQPPEKYAVQFWNGKAWADVAEPQFSPDKPAGGTVNTVTFKPVRTSKVRIVFTHHGKSRSGLTEIEIWEK